MSAAQAFLQHLQVERRMSAHTLDAYRRDLEDFLARVESRRGREPVLEDLNLREIRHDIADLFHDVKASTLARKLSSLRSFGEFLRREGALPDNEAALVRRPKQRPQLPVALPVEDITAMIDGDGEPPNDIAEPDFLFDTPQDAPLLLQVQHRIRDLVPLAEHPQSLVAPDDRSIQFHAAHSALREVEVLHDQLLDPVTAETAAMRLEAVAGDEAIEILNPETDFAKNGKPKVEAIEAVLGQNISAETRDKAWELYQKELAADEASGDDVQE